VQFWGLLRVLVTMGWSDDSKSARGGRGRQRAKTKEEQRIFYLNFQLARMCTVSHQTKLQADAMIRIFISEHVIL